MSNKSNGDYRMITAIVSVFLTLLLSCSCATKGSVQAHLPADSKMNRHAGRGDLVYVMVRLDTGKELPFALDTGSPVTVFDVSLKPKLGKCLGPFTIWNFGAKREGEIYTSPKLYLGNTELMMTGPNIVTCDLHKESSVPGADCPTMGILGMDVLEHYCVQLDFHARKVRFLNPRKLSRGDLGKRFPLEEAPDRGCAFISSPCLLGTRSQRLLVDTGFEVDGASNSEQFDQVVREQKLKMVSGCALFPKCDWNGGAYTNVIILKGECLLGLRFLARHLVTFDFPNRTMYLKQTTTGPLDKNVEKYFTR